MGPSQDQFLGCLLGLAVGDAVAAPYEGLTGEHLFWSFGSPHDLVKNPDGETLYYTDDTEMAIGVAEALAERGQVVEEVLCQTFASNYHPERGYGRGARLVIEAIAEGGDWRFVAQNHFPGGSLGNGAAMRVAPVGLLFADDLDLVMEQARLSALPTHVHPIGIEGAQLLAVAIALASQGPPLDRRNFFHELRRRATTEEFQWHLKTAARLRPGDNLGVLGNSLQAHRSVVSAMACFAHSSNSYESAIAHALSLGDDVDTLAAMTGALVGAHLGVQAVPPGLVEQLEDGPKGRRYVEQLAVRLYKRYDDRRKGAPT